MASRKRILVLEDELMVRKVLVRLLSSFGHNVSGASGGTEALGAFDEALNSVFARPLEQERTEVLSKSLDEERPLEQEDADGPIELLIADVSLGCEDGRAIAAQLRRKDPHLRVLFVSGAGTLPTSSEAVERTAYLSKPFSGNQLRGAVSDLFRGAS